MQKIFKAKPLPDGMVKPKETKKCKYCPKILREYNQSLICSSCRNKYRIEIAKEAIDEVKLL